MSSAAAQRSSFGQPLKRMLRASGTRVLGLASKAYVPGPYLDDAMAWASRTEQQGIAFTLGYFDGEGESRDEVAAQSLSAITAAAMSGIARTKEDAASAEAFRPYVSLKVPSLGYDPAILARLVKQADRAGQIIHFDSHGPDTATPTLEALGSLVAPGRRLSVTIPARWKRSGADVDWAVARGIRVRVVKGQWACPELPDVDLRESYLAIIDRLAAHGAEAVRAGRAPVAVAVATHDAMLAREALRRLGDAGCACELELLCGLPRRAALGVAKQREVPARLYIPFGAAWLPYALDQAVRSPRMMWWMVRDAITALR